MKKKSFLLVMFVIFGAIFSQVPVVVAGAMSGDVPPIKVVVVSGTNYEMGVQYGEQAAKLIAANRDVTWNILDNRVLDGSGNPLGHSIILKDIQVWTYYIEKYNPKLKEWLLGISQGCGNKGYAVSYTDLVALMVVPQELWARPQMDYPAETGVTAFALRSSSPVLAKVRTDTKAMASCTAFAATRTATPDGNAMVSLTLGFISEIKQYVILVAYPDEGYPFISLTMAGRVSSNTGMNSKYAWVMTASVTHPFLACASSWGVPSEAYFHFLQQYCKSPAEAMAYLDSTPKGGVTGIFLFADKSDNVLAYEVGSCGAAVRRPGDLGERDFIATTNNYNGAAMAPYAIPAEWFSDTYVRYATIFKRLSSARPGKIGLNFTKASWLSNDWYDAATDTWNTVPVPNDPADPNTCNVPGNNCEGGESQVIQFPAQNIAYLQPGGPHGTSIQYYWPDNPKPTGEYTKWQLKRSIPEVTGAASRDALKMIEVASDSFNRKARYLDSQTRSSLKRLLMQAKSAWYEGRVSERLAKSTVFGCYKDRVQNKQIPLWSAANTNYATAQLYAQMVTTKLKSLFQ